MATHTPGPWTSGEPAWYRGRTDPSTGKRPISAGEHGVIANVYGEANASLIAAAPDMLDALKSTLNYWESTGFAECDPGCDCIVEAVRAAIAKAEGGAK